MKYLNITIIVLVLFLYGCNQADSKTQLTKVVNIDETTNNRTLKQKNQSNYVQLEGFKVDNINDLITLFKEINIDKISNKISFPLFRVYPIPPINDKEEFKLRFNEVFDEVLIAKIADSKIDQWSEMGWRGIKLNNGIVWMANSDGKITGVNYQSDYENKLRKKLIANEKETLHISLKTYESPTYRIKTMDYLIRIDELANHKYRYASWKISEKESSKPDIILENGELEYQGSGGNHVITFYNNNYTYKIYRNLMGPENSPEITLAVEKDRQIILTQNATLE